MGELNRSIDVALSGGNGGQGGFGVGDTHGLSV